ncbi:MAG: acyl-ACP--UDP-N-acetylglucosamine O-acyltransferase [Bradyrhizobium sp.]|uniref:acyl-ACP--UDP-N-acetylglucosamine O-acyltransferase n=1 Tax=Bradyrhizobium sp. TaxID=376 RepID=UPI003D0B7D42
MIDPTARVHPSARLGADVTVGPWTIIDANVEIGAGTRIDAHCIIRGPTRIGCDNRIFPFCSIGEDPQDKKFVAGSPTRLEIGDRNTIREYCSINRGTPGGGGVTTLGSDNWIMAYCHVAHDCHVGNHTIFANNATLAGHVEIGDYAILAGFVGVHQFCRVGESSFMAISAVIVKDVPPFVMAEGNTARARAINREGMRRRGMSTDVIEAVRRAYKILYRQGLTVDKALVELKPLAAQFAEVQRFTEFVSRSERGIVRCRPQ